MNIFDSTRKRIETLDLIKRRSKELGLSIVEYYQAFFAGQIDRNTENKCPFNEGEKALADAYNDGKNS